MDSMLVLPEPSARVLRSLFFPTPQQEQVADLVALKYGAQSALDTHAGYRLAKAIVEQAGLREIADQFYEVPRALRVADSQLEGMKPPTLPQMLELQPLFKFWCLKRAWSYANEIILMPPNQQPATWTQPFDTSDIFGQLEWTSEEPQRFRSLRWINSSSLANATNPLFFFQPLSCMWQLFQDMFPDKELDAVHTADLMALCGFINSTPDGKTRATLLDSLFGDGQWNGAIVPPSMGMPNASETPREDQRPVVKRALCNLFVRQAVNEGVNLVSTLDRERTVFVEAPKPLSPPFRRTEEVVSPGPDRIAPRPPRPQGRLPTELPLQEREREAELRPMTLRVWETSTAGDGYADRTALSSTINPVMLESSMRVIVTAHEVVREYVRAHMGSSIQVNDDETVYAFLKQHRPSITDPDQLFLLQLWGCWEALAHYTIGVLGSTMLWAYPTEASMPELQGARSVDDLRLPCQKIRRSQNALRTLYQLLGGSASGGVDELMNEATEGLQRASQRQGGVITEGDVATWDQLSEVLNHGLQQVRERDTMGTELLRVAQRRMGVRLELIHNKGDLPDRAPLSASASAMMGVKVPDSIDFEDRAEWFLKTLVQELRRVSPNHTIDPVVWQTLLSMIFELIDSWSTRKNSIGKDPQEQKILEFLRSKDLFIDPTIIKGLAVWIRNIQQRQNPKFEAILAMLTAFSTPIDPAANATKQWGNSLDAFDGFGSTYPARSGDSIWIISTAYATFLSTRSESELRLPNDEWNKLDADRIQVIDMLKRPYHYTYTEKTKRCAALGSLRSFDPASYPQGSRDKSSSNWWIHWGVFLVQTCSNLIKAYMVNILNQICRLQINISDTCGVLQSNVENILFADIMRTIWAHGEESVITSMESFIEDDHRAGRLPPHVIKKHLEEIERERQRLKAKEEDLRKKHNESAKRLKAEEKRLKDEATRLNKADAERTAQLDKLQAECTDKAEACQTETAKYKARVTKLQEDYQQQQDAMRAQREAHAQQIERLKAREAQLTQQLATSTNASKETIQKLREDLADCQDKLKDTESQRDTLSVELEACEKRERELQANLEGYEAARRRVADLEEEIKDLQQKAVVYQQQCNTQMKDYEQDCNDRVAEQLEVIKQGHAKELQQRAEALQDQQQQIMKLEDVRMQFEALLEERNALQDQLAGLQEQLATLAANADGNAALQAENVQLQNQLQQLQRENQTLLQQGKDMCATLQTQNDTLQDQNTALQAQITQITGERDRLLTAGAEIQNENGVLRTQNAELRAEIERLRAENEQLQGGTPGTPMRADEEWKAPDYTPQMNTTVMDEQQLQQFITQWTSDRDKLREQFEIALTAALQQLHPFQPDQANATAEAYKTFINQIFEFLQNYNQLDEIRKTSIKELTTRKNELITDLQEAQAETVRQRNAITEAANRETAELRGQLATAQSQLDRLRRDNEVLRTNGPAAKREEMEDEESRDLQRRMQEQIVQLMRENERLEALTGDAMEGVQEQPAVRERSRTPYMISVDRLLSAIINVHKAATEYVNRPTTAIELTQAQIDSITKLMESVNLVAQLNIDKSYALRHSLGRDMEAITELWNALVQLKQVSEQMGPPSARYSDSQTRAITQLWESVQIIKELMPTRGLRRAGFVEGSSLAQQLAAVTQLWEAAQQIRSAVQQPSATAITPQQLSAVTQLWEAAQRIRATLQQSNTSSATPDQLAAVTQLWEAAQQIKVTLQHPSASSATAVQQEAITQLWEAAQRIRTTLQQPSSSSATPEQLAAVTRLWEAAQQIRTALPPPASSTTAAQQTALTQLWEATRNVESALCNNRTSKPFGSGKTEATTQLWQSINMVETAMRKQLQSVESGTLSRHNASIQQLWEALLKVNTASSHVSDSDWRTVCLASRPDQLKAIETLWDSVVSVQKMVTGIGIQKCKNDVGCPEADALWSAVVELQKTERSFTTSAAHAKANWNMRDDVMVTLWESVGKVRSAWMQFGRTARTTNNTCAVELWESAMRVRDMTGAHRFRDTCASYLSSAQDAATKQLWEAMMKVQNLSLRTQGTADQQACNAASTQLWNAVTQVKGHTRDLLSKYGASQHMLVNRASGDALWEAAMNVTRQMTRAVEPRSYASMDERIRAANELWESVLSVEEKTRMQGLIEQQRNSQMDIARVDAAQKLWESVIEIKNLVVLAESGDMMMNEIWELYREEFAILYKDGELPKDSPFANIKELLQFIKNFSETTTNDRIEKSALYNAVNDQLKECRARYVRRLELERKDLRKLRTKQAGLVRGETGTDEEYAQSWVAHVVGLTQNDEGAATQLIREIVEVTQGSLPAVEQKGMIMDILREGLQLSTTNAELDAVKAQLEQQKADCAELRRELNTMRKPTPTPETYEWEYISDDRKLVFRDSLITALQSAVNVAIELQMSQLMADSKTATGVTAELIDWVSQYPFGHKFPTSIKAREAQELEAEIISDYPDMLQTADKRELTANDLLCGTVTWPKDTSKMEQLRSVLITLSSTMLNQRAYDRARSYIPTNFSAIFDARKREMVNVLLQIGGFRFRRTWLKYDVPNDPCVVWLPQLELRGSTRKRKGTSKERKPTKQQIVEANGGVVTWQMLTGADAY